MFWNFKVNELELEITAILHYETPTSFKHWMF